MRQIWRNIRLAITVKRATIRLRYAIRMAELAHAKTGDRYYVMPDHHDKLIIMRRNGVRRFRRLGYMDRRVRMNDIMKECFYCTADRSEQKLSASITEAKRVMYIQYTTRNI